MTSTWLKSAKTAETCAAALYLLQAGLADLAQVAENSGPVWPSARALFHTAAAEFAKIFLALAWSVGSFVAIGDFIHRANSRTATPLKDGQSNPVQLTSQPSNSTGDPLTESVGFTCAVESRVAKRAASVS